MTPGSGTARSHSPHTSTRVCPGDHDHVVISSGLASHLAFGGLRGLASVYHHIRDPVADLVRMALLHKLGEEENQVQGGGAARRSSSSALTTATMTNWPNLGILSSARTCKFEVTTRSKPDQALVFWIGEGCKARHGHARIGGWKQYLMWAQEV